MTADTERHRCVRHSIQLHSLACTQRDKLLSCVLCAMRCREDETGVRVAYVTSRFRTPSRSAESCPVSCIHWVEKADLAALEYVMQVGRCFRRVKL